VKPFDSNGMFISAAPGGGGALRRLAVRGAGMTVLSGVLSLAIQVIATVVLARLLTPRDFGLVTMVTTFSLLLSNFGINGITEAIVQREHLDHILASNLFWMNLAGGLLLTCGFAAAGSAIAKFFGEPLVAPIAAGIAISIVLTSPSVVHLALLKRAMHFPAVAKNDIVAKAASVGSVHPLRLGWMGLLGACARHLCRGVELNHWRMVALPLVARPPSRSQWYRLHDEVCHVHLWPILR
jgi:O-antigen/teichoic acid export membrane protein